MKQKRFWKDLYKQLDAQEGLDKIKSKRVINWLNHERLRDKVHDFLWDFKVYQLIEKIFKNTYWFFKNFPNNLLRIMIYFPIIWRDRDWDQGFFTDLIIFKLERMEKFFSNPENTHLEHSDDVTKQLTDVIECFATYNGEPLAEERKKHNKKWGDCDFDFGPEQVKENGIKYYTSNGMKYKKAKTDKENEQANNESSKIHEREQKLKDDGLKNAFILIEKNIRGWWD